MSFNEQLIIYRGILLSVLDGGQAEWTRAYGTTYDVDSVYFKDMAIDTLTTGVMDSDSNFIPADSLSSEVVASSSLGFRVSFSNQSNSVNVRTIILCASGLNGDTSYTDLPILAVGVSSNAGSSDGLYLPSSNEPSTKVVLALNLTFPSSSDLSGVTTISADSVTEDFVRNYVDSTLGTGFVTIDTDQTVTGTKNFNSINTSSLSVATISSSNFVDTEGIPLVLKSVPSVTVSILKAVMNICGCPLAYARSYVSNTPSVLKVFDTQNDAIDALNTLEGLGCVCSVGSSERTSDYAVQLISTTDKINTIKKVRNYTGFGLSEAKTLVDSAPSIIVSFDTLAEAESCVSDFALVGAETLIIHTEDAPIILDTSILPDTSTSEVKLGSVSSPFSEITANVLKVSEIQGLSEDGVSLALSSTSMETIQTGTLRPLPDTVRFKVVLDRFWNSHVPDDMKLDFTSEEVRSEFRDTYFPFESIPFPLEDYYQEALDIGLRYDSINECVEVTCKNIEVKFDAYDSKVADPSLIVSTLGTYEKPTSIFTRSISGETSTFELGSTPSASITLDGVEGDPEYPWSLLSLSVDQISGYSFQHGYYVNEDLDHTDFCLVDSVRNNMEYEYRQVVKRIYTKDSEGDVSFSLSIDADNVLVKSTGSISLDGKVSFSKIDGFAPTTYVSASSETEVPIGCNVMLYVNTEVLVGQKLTNCYVALIKNGSVAKGQKIRGTFTALSQGQSGVPCAILAICHSK